MPLFCRIATTLALAVALATAQVPAFARDASVAVSPETSLSGNYLAGRLAGSERDADAASAFFRAALRADPKNQELLDRAFLWVLAEGKADEAMKLAERLLQTNPSHREARLAVAVQAIKNKQYATARTHLGQGVRGPLADLTTNLITGWTYLGSGDLPKALQTIDRLKGAEWYAVFRDFHSGLIADVAGKTKDAESRIEAAFAADRTALRIVEETARLRSRTAGKEKALAALEDFEAALPRHPLIRKTRAEIEAGRQLPALVGDPREGVAEVLYGLGGALARQGGEDLATVYLRLALYLVPDHTMALVTVADLYESLEQHGRAIAAYESVPADSPLKHNADVQAAMALDKLDRTDEAVAKLEKLIAEDAKDYDAILALGNVLRGRKRYSEAAEVYSKAVALVPQPDRSQWTLFYVRGIAYERSQQWEKAEADLKKALELSPEQPSVLNYLGYSWVDQGRNLEEGLDMIRRAVELRPDDGYIVDSLGWAYYRLGRYEEAVTELERAVELRPQDPVLNDHLGDAYWRVGRRLEANFQWSHALGLDPEPEDKAKIEAKLKNGLPEDAAATSAEAAKPNGG